MKFAYQDMLFLLWVVAIAAGFTIFGIKKQKNIISKFASKTALHSIAPKISFHRKWIKGLLLIFALFFLCISMAGPLAGFKWKKMEQKGVDIMIALDCSRSMLCQDIKPSRLKRAKREIIDLLKIMESDRAGLVAFAGEAILQCPLTLDHNAFNIFLDVLEPDYLPVGGTDIAGAIETCLNSFETDTNSSKAIILITDGEDTTSNLAKEVVKKASQEKVKIFCIGMGSEDGAPIPDKNGGFKKDINGDMIISKVDEKGLKELALLGNGKYVRSVTGDMDLNVIYSNGIRADMEKKTLKSFRQKVWENRYQWFLLPCIILLFAELIISRRKKTNNLIVILAILLIFFTVSPTISYAGIGTSLSVGSDTKEGIKAFEEQNFGKAEKKFIDAQLKDPDNAYHYYNIGTAAYKKQDYDSALKNFQKAMESKDLKLKHKAQFNIGNTQFRKGHLEESIKTFEKLTKDHLVDDLAKENLEFVKKKIEEKKKQEQQDKNKKGNQDKQDKKDKQENKDQDKDQNQNKGKDTDKDKDETGQKDQQPEQKPEQKQDSMAPKPEQADQGQDKNDKTAAGSKKNMLNRLEDKPGKAMMQILQKRGVEKDW